MSDDPPARSAVESNFPTRRVNALAASESYNKHHYRPTNYQHKWWARRLGSVFRGLCLAALSPAGTSADEVWARHARANGNRFEDCVVLDPFMGGGTTGQEATRLGAKFVGADLNPVAWFVARMGLAPAPEGLDSRFRAVVDRAEADVRPYYRTRCRGCGAATQAAFYLWVERTGDGERRYDTLVVDHDDDGGATAVCPGCGALSVADAPAAAACDACDREFDATREDVVVAADPPRVTAGGGDPTYEPYAVRYDCDCDHDAGGFAAFDADDAERYAAAAARFADVRDDLPLPTETVPTGGEKTRALRRRGYTRWTDLFNSRQLLALGRLLAGVRDVDDDRSRHYLLLTLSAALEFNNMFCSYKGAAPSAPGAVRHIFSHHAYVHPGEPLENNPLGAAARQSGTLPYLYDYRLKRALSFKRAPVERVLGDDGTVAAKRTLDGERVGGRPADSLDDLLSGDATHYLHCGDGASLSLDDVTVDAVVTDPPYYDSVQYAELADFFYVWLKRGLKPEFPDAFGADSVVSDAEAVGNRSREKSLDDYRRLLERVFDTAAAALDDGPLVFTFHHRRAEAWGAVLSAVTGAGFRVVATYPVRGENRLSVHIDGQRAIQLDSVVVCRVAGERSPRAWADVVDAVERDARERLAAFRASDDEDLSALDAGVVVRGVGMRHLSAHEVHDDGELLSPGEAMARLAPVTERLNERR